MFELPVLDGAWRTAAEDDLRTFGRHHVVRAAAVFQPRSAGAVAELLRHAVHRSIRVAVRGRGHATYDQSDPRGGWLVDTRLLDTCEVDAGGTAWVGAGATWRGVVAHALPARWTPPVLTDYLDLSVGGTLSVGGIGGESFRRGPQVDHVLELEVVTGAGEVVRCSEQRRRDLFDACRAGVGRCGIITAARLRLVPAPVRVVTHYVECPSLHVLLERLTSSSEDERVGHIYANILPAAPGAWLYQLVVSRFEPDTSGSPDVAPPFGDLGCTTRVWPYSQFVARVDEYVTEKQRDGTWQMAHPWLDLLLPVAEAEPFIAEELRGLTPHLLGGGSVLLYQIGATGAPLARLPECERSVLFDVLRNCPVDDVSRLHAQLDANRRAYRRSVTLGGGLYPIGSTPMTPDEWDLHFSRMPGYSHTVRRFDPSGVLHGVESVA